MNLRTAYAKMAEGRQRYLQDADNLARLIDPSLQPLGQRIDELPHTHEGTQAHRSLASSLIRTMFPSGVKFFKMGLPAAIASAVSVSAGEQGVQALSQMFSGRENDVLSALAQKGSRSRFGPIIRRNLIEGQNVVFNSHDALRFYPLRSFVVEREAGMERIIIIREVRRPNPMDTNTNFGMNAGVHSANTQNADEQYATYTMVDYENWVVMVQEPGQDEAHASDDLNPAQFFCFVGEIPDIDDYVHGYAHAYIRLIAQINHADASLAEAMSIAAWNFPTVLAGSMTAARLAEFTKNPSGKPFLVESHDEIGWLGAGTKIGEWAFIAASKASWKSDLAAAFAMGIKDRFAGDQSATAILEIIDELSTQTQDLMSAYEETLQRRLVKSEIALHEMVNPLLPDLPVPITDIAEITITSGTAAIQAQKHFGDFIGQDIPIVKQLDPRVIVNGGAVLDAIRDARQIGRTDLYEVAQPNMPGGPIQNTQGGDPEDQTVMTPGGPQNPGLQSRVQPRS